jgi:two-component system sensor histidine kinase KdpD
MSARPDPDALLARVRADLAREGRGRLKLFFGAAPGVGKTFTMLEAAQTRRREGVDVLAGVVETHGRPETAKLLEGLPVLGRRPIEYRGVTLHEFDLDAALARHPQLILVDELAHTNAPGSRHAKRWQDVSELLDAGINVFSTLNVQHVDSLNDVVAQITGVTVRETVPDAVFEGADEIELVDVSPDVLLQRLREGKVYVPEQASRALDRFFRRGNLIALRELSLRQTANRVDAEMRGYMQAEGIRETWPATERLLVCVGPDPASARLVRATRRMAERLQADWFAIYVETPTHYRLGEAAKEAVVENLRLAEQLGGRTATLVGVGIADEILAWAQSNNVTRIVVGKPAPAMGLFGRRRSLLDALVRGSGAIDVYVITGAGEAPRPESRRRPTPPREYGLALATVLAATGLCLVLRPVLTTIDDAMVFLLAVVVTATRARQGPAIAAAILSIGFFDFFFVPPFYTFAVSDVRYALTFAVMLVISIVMSRLTGRIREQAEGSRAREQRTSAAYALSRDVAAAREPAQITAAAARHIQDAFASRVTTLLPDEHGALPGEDGIAQWVLDHGRMAGLGTDTLPASPALYLPLVASSGTLGVVRIEPRDPQDALDPVRRQLLETFVGQEALALARALLAERQQRTQVEVEAERLRTSLLSSLSHDLRTPLAGIEGAASSLLEEVASLTPGVRREHARTILEESQRMTRLIANLLDMVRLETGSLGVQKEWQPLEEVVGVALIRLDERLAGHPVTTALPADLPLVPIDGILIEQVLINLVENAIKYAPTDTPIEISATASDRAVTMSVADRGPGIPSGEEERIFDKFHRAPSAGASTGVGLGLTICRGIVTAHGGRIWVEHRPGGGAVFQFTLPLEGAQPPAPPAEAPTVDSLG